ncbi:MAG: nicotinamide mononucleotide transporter [Bacteroidales bacterium]|nr:nicotinamide mononucleotide transporter [Bacteroidales bacterium]
MENIVTWLSANSSWIQAISLFCGVTYMTLQIFQHKWMWYFSIATSTTALIVASTNHEGAQWAPLWAQVILNIYLIVIAILGIIRWRKLDGEAGGQLHVVPLKRKRLLIVLAIIAVGAPLVSFILSKTSDPAPVLDGTSLVLSFVAAWLLSRSHIEQYPLWVIANILIISVYATQSKWLMAVMYSYYIVTCVIGFINWKKNGVIVEE